MFAYTMTHLLQKNYTNPSLSLDVCPIYNNYMLYYMLYIIPFVVIMYITVYVLYLTLQFKKHPCIISIEGNIGSGKSTLLANLKIKFKNVIFLCEPVEDWEFVTNENGKTILKLFYEDPTANAFAFQMLAFVSRLKLLRETVQNNPDAIIITERCLYTDKMVFAKMLFDSGHIKIEHYKIYLQWFDAFASDFHIQKIIYVKTDPETCHKRILQRSRDGENIPKEYLNKCDTYHEDMINIHKNNYTDLLVLDGNIDIYKNTYELNEWVNKIHSFIHNIHI